MYEPRMVKMAANLKAEVRARGWGQDTGKRNEASIERHNHPKVAGVRG